VAGWGPGMPAARALLNEEGSVALLRHPHRRASARHAHTLAAGSPERLTRPRCARADPHAHLLPPGNAWAFAADATGRHRSILLLTFAAAGVLRYALWHARGFWPLLATVLAVEVAAAPVMVLADAATQAAGKRDTDYGRSRLFGAVGVGVFSPVNGALVTRYGIVSHVEAGVGVAGWRARGWRRFRRPRPLPPPPPPPSTRLSSPPPRCG
jgi:hypothetical protein